VAIIQEYNAKGPLTKALYSVVGFDDGLGIIIFGFAAAFAKSMIMMENGGTSESFLSLVGGPLREIGLSIAIGLGIAFIFGFLIRKMQNKRDVFILIFSSVLLTAGISLWLNLSVILTNMVVGIYLVNTQPHTNISRISESLKDVMPLLFILFFMLAGANLHIHALPALGVIGLVYIGSRTLGLAGGSMLGAAVSRSAPVIRKYLGMGILSQAGVAIGLALIVKQEFSELGEAGSLLGSSVITTITATCIFFEIIGPILTKIGLQKAGEIPPQEVRN
jgi:hypothetical protein